MWSPLCTNQLSNVANKAGVASSYFVIRVIIWTANTIGLVSDSQGVGMSKPQISISLPMSSTQLGTAGAMMECLGVEH